MKPLSNAMRPARWLVAAGLALASIMPSPAAAQVPELSIEPGGPSIHPEHGAVVPFFEKTGAQKSCDHVVYRLKFGLRANPETFLSEIVAGKLAELRLDFSDQLPPGLEIVHVAVSGDATGPGGGAMPAHAVSSTANPDDTVTIDDFRMSAADLDGLGAPNERVLNIRITAKIDQAAFPAPTIVDNQGFVEASFAGGPAVETASHDPALPEDGDWKTGDPTKVLIDVTDCEPPPPPPPGDEACFEVETGDVDCVAGGGAYIYNMAVGADMAGKWVQLRTTTPGISIDPPAQLVPAGGGVLSWEITGAAPGDTVHLIVTGIETYAGPEEGVGLCCTQTVDLVIPPDLECPPEDREPDIKVEKRADVARCTIEGGCDFTIRVTNAGDAPYTGPIVLDEVTTPGSAAVVSGPNAPWSCLPMASPMSCTHPAITLDPGDWVELKLGFAPGPGWEARTIRNCAEYDYTASGKLELFGDPGNDKACASIRICRRGDRDCRPPVERRVDLRITKEARTLACSADGVCTFNVRVFNNGTVPHVGPLTVIDEYPTGAPVSSTFAPAPWACGPDGPGRFRCDHPGLVLLPGAWTPIGVSAVVGPDYPSDFIENCAEVQPIEDESNLGNNRACARMRVPNRNPGQPAMRIAKTCAPAAAGAATSCRITVTNAGTAAPSGPVRVSDAATLIGAGTPVQIQTVTPDGAEWDCGPVPADALSCRIPGAAMTPGTSRHFDVTVAAPANGRFENCARGSYGPAPGNHLVYPFGEACDEGGTAISVEKTGDRECRVGQPCTFEITIRNDGDTGFSGPVRIGDAVGVDGIGRLEGVPVSSVEPPFGCAPEPATLPISCVAELTLGAGESRVHRVTVVIPEGGALANLRGEVSGRNCVAVLSPETRVLNGGGALTIAPSGGETDRGSAHACHPFTISQPEQQQCSAGFVMNANGRCVCPEGTSFRNGQCVGGGTVVIPIPPEKPEPQLCTLLPGQIRTQAGECVCPRGTRLRNNRCVTIEQPEPQCRLLPGQIRTQSGDCVCPRGTRLRNNRCVAIEQPKPQCRLLPGQIRTQAGECVCPRGTTLIRGACRTRTVECPQGTRLVDGRCLRIVQERCPAGTVGTPPNCRKLPVQINPNVINPNILRQIIPPQRRQTNPNRVQ